ncbi:MAG: hypothetical protein ALECFALPRED_006177 [Alectoria fallacina]|uniref:DNA-directed RNA polymerase III subunit RPC9 n=1 Tax=Alectoria fallacina TaxID=1903189 RepID=A0A8H3FZ14_9LECA|nr:MAG: hypothetical protein ALECFALPRED_006177 [Alectoria fallacina]
MKILESQSAVLSNYEVLAHLTANPAKPRTTPQKHTNVDTVIKELTDYLSPPPTSRSRIPRYQNAPYSDGALGALITGLQPYNLTKSEVLMIVNLRPESLGLLDCVVEECDERFTTEQQDEIVRIVGHVLGREGDGVEENGVNGHGSHGEVVNGNGTNGTNRSGDHGEEMEENGST